MRAGAGQPAARESDVQIPNAEWQNGFMLPPYGQSGLGRALVVLDALAIPDSQARLQAKHSIGRAITELSNFATPTDIEKAFDKILDWAIKYRIAPQRVFLGEFGVMRPNVDADSRRRWLTAVRTAAERRQFPWSYWSLEAPEYMGLHVDRNRRLFDPIILKALGFQE